VYLNPKTLELGRTSSICCTCDQKPPRVLEPSLMNSNNNERNIDTPQYRNNIQDHGSRTSEVIDAAQNGRRIDVFIVFGGLVESLSTERCKPRGRLSATNPNRLSCHILCFMLKLSLDARNEQGFLLVRLFLLSSSTALSRPLIRALSIRSREAFCVTRSRCWLLRPAPDSVWKRTRSERGQRKRAAAGKDQRLLIRRRRGGEEGAGKDVRMLGERPHIGLGAVAQEMIQGVLM
jgi:hypothetical protein